MDLDQFLWEANSDDWLKIYGGVVTGTMGSDCQCGVGVAATWLHTRPSGFKLCCNGTSAIHVYELDGKHVCECAAYICEAP